MAPVPAIDHLGAERRAEGRRFVEAIQELGLFPDLATWVEDRLTHDFRIALVTPLVDRIGARPLYVVLEKAYKAAAIKIDPLEIELFSPASRFTVELVKQISRWDQDLHPYPIRERQKTVNGMPITVIEHGEPIIIVDDTVVAPSWGYEVRRSKSRRIGSLDKEFRAFQDHVQRRMLETA